MWVIFIDGFVGGIGEVNVFVCMFDGSLWVGGVVGLFCVVKLGVEELVVEWVEF